MVVSQHPVMLHRFGTASSNLAPFTAKLVSGKMMARAASPVVGVSKSRRGQLQQMQSMVVRDALH
jgi:hypothetical protein